MKMANKKVRFFVRTNVVGSKVEDTIELPAEDCNEKSLAELGRDWVHENIDFGWEVIEEDN